MELPANVLIHNELLGLKGGKGNLVRISPDGYYEVNLSFGAQVHRVLMPVGETIIISSEPEVASAVAEVEIER